MKAKQFVTAVIVLLVCGLGLYGLLRWHRTAAASPAEEDKAGAPLVSVQTGTIQRMTLHRYVDGYGTVMPAPATAGVPAADAPLAAPTAGVVAAVDVVEGQHVARGQLIMTLNSSTLTAAYAKQEVARQKDLYAQHNASLQSLQAAETQLALLRVTAPIAGTVTSVKVKPGAAVDLNTVVAEIMDLRRLVITAGIPEGESASLKVGEPMTVEARTPVAAAVSYISPTVNPMDGTIRIRAALPSDCGLRPGQFLRLHIVTGVHRDALAVPVASVVTDIAGHSIVSLVRDGHSVVTPVQVGFRENGWVEVRGPKLKVGETVVTVGAYGLPNGSRLQVEKSPAETRSPSPPNS